MKGNNELLLNEATMIVAMQEYIDKRITIDTPLVKCVKFKNDTFTIGLEEQTHGQNDSKS